MIISAALLATLFVPFQFHAAVPTAVWKSSLSPDQFRTLERIALDTKPQYRDHLKIAFDGSRHLLVIFSKSAVPEDDGPESYVLSSCSVTPTCRHACDLQLHYSERTVVALPMKSCLDGQLYFLNDN